MASQMAVRLASAFRPLSRYPLTSLTVGGTTGLVTHAILTEKRTEQLEKSFHCRNDAKLSPQQVARMQLPREYSREDIEIFWKGRPVTVALRVLDIAYEMMPLFASYVKDFHLHLTDREDVSSELSLQKHHAKQLRAALTRLGPAFVKGGQQLSIRPDLLPPAVLAELQKLCDNVDPVNDDIALDVIRTELELESVEQLKEVFEGMHLVASASLGQVYKASIRETNETVAIKVQRPDMLRQVSLDMFLIQLYAKTVDAFCTTFTKQPPFHVDFFDCFAHGSYAELDYENEANNQIYFRTEFEKRKSKVYVPLVHEKYTTRRVLTTEWVDGVKLADAPKEQIRQLIPVGVELFLTQLLDIGVFHADPHPGNLYVSPNGTLCLLDFGLCAKVDEKARDAMTTAIVHLLIGDFDSLISKDAKRLGFLPEDLDITDIKPILTKILNEGLLESGSNLHSRRRKLMEISNELNEVFFRYPFSVPPFFALITRGLGLLEGIALTGDPNFDIFQASFPYAKRRAVEMVGWGGLNHIRRKLTGVQS